MMTAQEYKNRIVRKNLLIIVFLSLCLVGVSGAVVYYNKLKRTTKALKIAEINLQRKNDSLNKLTKNLQDANISLQILHYRRTRNLHYN